MEALLGLWVMLIGTCYVAALGTHCDRREDGAECYGALGGTLVLHLMNNISEIPRYELRKDSSVILRGRKKVLLSNTLEYRSVFIPSDGTLSIKELSKNDTGEYTLQTFDSNGIRTGNWTLHLSVQACVSSVQLVSECLSQGQMKVSCSSEGGDSPQYSWTLDGHTLTDSELVSGNNQTNIIVLRENISGRLICSVRNQVSQSFRHQMIPACTDPSLLGCGLLFLVAVLSFGGIGLYFKWKEKKHKNESIAAEMNRDLEEFAVVELRGFV